MAACTYTNRKIDPRTYSHLCRSERERSLLISPPMVDGFFDIHNPREKTDFEPRGYRTLYNHIVAQLSPDEITSWPEMTRTFRDMAVIDSSPELQETYGKLRYHDIVAVSGRTVVGFTSLVTMPFGQGNCGDQGSQDDRGSAITYVMYLGTADSKFMLRHYHRRDNFREKGLARLFFVLGHGVAEEDAQKLGYARTVAGTMLEAELIGQAKTAEAIRQTKLRLEIYQRLGALAVMIDTGSGLITPHVQPQLSVDSNPIILHLLFRPLEVDPARLGVISEVSREFVCSLLDAYASNFEWQSTPEEMAQLRRFSAARLSAANRFVLVPPDQLPNIAEMAQTDTMLRNQLETDLGTLEVQERKIKKALG